MVEAPGVQDRTVAHSCFRVCVYVEPSTIGNEPVLRSEVPLPRQPHDLNHMRPVRRRVVRADHQKDQTMARLFEFGEALPEYPVRVLNEREARAGAGILFLVSAYAFLQAVQQGEFAMTRMAILAFAIDFFIRVLVNPRYAPSLVLGRFMVRNQVPEYVGAPQKRFAWGLGLGIAVFMLVWMFFLNLAGPVALLACVTCILLLFFETAFGICIGCKLYGLLFWEKAQLCPGGVCELQTRAPITRLGAGPVTVLASVAAVLALATPHVARLDPPRMFGTAALETCEPLAFARLVGHEEKWKARNGCL